jgi:hypothetical protein
MLLPALCLCAALTAGESRAQDTSTIVFLPQGHSFRPPRADQKEPGFFAAYLSTTSIARTTGVGSTGLGEDIGLIGGDHGRWDISLAAGVFSQFDMRTSSYDLLNTDFVIGVPFAWHLGAFALRARAYHQS